MESVTKVRLLRALLLLRPELPIRTAERLGTNRSVLSNAMAGRRPLPEYVAGPLLKELGLTPRGELDHRHCFGIYVRRGLEMEAEWLLKELFPMGGGRIHLSRDGEHGIGPDEAHKWSGVALWDGAVAAVLQEEEDTGLVTLPASFPLLDYDNSAGDLLHLSGRIDKAAVVRRFESRSLFPASWKDAVELAKEYGMTSSELIALIIANARRSGRSDDGG